MQSEAEFRFTDRALFYAEARPGYPDAVMDSLRQHPGLVPGSTVADMGSGTGLSAELFLHHGHTVFAVEPDPAMRTLAERRLAHRAAFHSIDGRAEASTLPDASADMVVCGSAFHWFDPASARTEFRRVLRPAGAVCILRNGRRTGGSEFMREYAALFRRYAARTGARAGRAGAVRDFFAGAAYRTEVIGYRERIGFDLLRARLLSYATVPLPGEPGHDEMIRRLRAIFERAAGQGPVWYLGEVTLHAGRMRQSETLPR